MWNITNSLSEPKDKRVYMLAGGQLKRSMADGILKKCSVTSMNIEELGIYNSVPAQGPDAAPVIGIAVDNEFQQNTSDDNSFTWSKITTKYKSRSIELSNVNLYLWTVHHWSKNNKTIPQFFGYDNSPTWPLKEEYSKWMLTFFKPWRTDINDLKAMDGTFKTALEEYMWEIPAFPWQIRQQILRIKRNEVGVDLSASGALNGDDYDISPTNNREHTLNEEAAVAAEGLIEDYDVNIREDDYEDIDDEVFRTMNMRIPENHDWSTCFNIQVSAALTQLKKTFYEEQMNSYIHNHEGIHLKLLQEELHRPENAKTDAQKFIIYHHLYWQRQWYLFQNRLINIIPPMQTIYVEGLPGVGKTFLINTLRNIIKIIAGRNDADAASAPTGCAAALIDGSTHARLMSIPVGRNAVKAPTNLVNTNANKLQYLKASCSALDARLMDEHSMMGLQDWAWAKYRNEELRRKSPPVMDEELNEVSVNQDNVNLNDHVDATLPLDDQTHERQWGGIPFLYSFGDTNQLPPVAKRSTYDTRPPKQGADRLGKMAFHDFINTTDESESVATVVVMDDVLRQRDERFKTLLQHMREGTMDDDDINMMFSRVIHNLPEVEKQHFLSEGLHLVPTWKEAHAINLEYINTNLNTPIARYEAKMNTCKNNGKNCCISECNFPLRSLLCVGAKVMLLDNFIVEYKLMNGSVGVVKKLCFSNPEGTPDEKMYVVVDFPDSTVPDEQKLIPDEPATYVPIPLVTRRCEKN